jgi:hypothetical protein
MERKTLIPYNKKTNTMYNIIFDSITYYPEHVNDFYFDSKEERDIYDTVDTIEEAEEMCENLIEELH